MTAIPSPEPVRRAGGDPAAAVRGGTRSEIQALRAIAVGLVVAYHLHPAAVPGGYIGVDVFFVISGFLISRHLLSEAARTGRVGLAAFWAGRVRRILPASLVTTVAVVVVATVVLPRTASAEIGRTGLFAAISAANWLFAADAVDYQAQAPDASPFEHFWSLGVEEQCYLVWPLLVLAPRRGRGWCRRGPDPAVGAARGRPEPDSRGTGPGSGIPSWTSRSPLPARPRIGVASVRRSGAVNVRRAHRSRDQCP